MLNPSIVAATAALLLLPRLASAAETLGTEIVVRVYDASDTKPEDRHAALDVAASILSAASVDVLWVGCTRSERHVAARIDRCSRPLAPGELVLRLGRSPGEAPTTQAPWGHGRELPLGHAFVDRSGGSSVLATVYLDRVAWLAARVGMDRRTILGRAIAHELAHLLMATTDHGSAGLMRPVWLRREFQRRDARDWALSADDAWRIRERSRMQAPGTR